MIWAIIKSMRPRQWVKNGFIFAAMVFDRQLTNPETLLRTIAGAILFSMLSGSVYIINDILDIEADKNHPKKSKRPIASGKLPIPIALLAAIFLFVCAVAAGYWLSFKFSIILGIYFVMQLAYSTRLKHVPMIDVLIISAGFVLRVAGGVSLIAVERFSPWLYVITSLATLYVGFGKRRAEIIMLGSNANSHRRVLEGYNLPLLDQLITIVSSTTIISYSFYTFSAPNLPTNHAMMLTIPFVMYGIFRYMYLIHVKKEGGIPEDLLFSDRPLQAAIVMWGLSVLLIFYVF